MQRDLRPDTECTHCRVAIGCQMLKPDAWPYWSYNNSYIKRGEEYHTFYPCCAGCAVMELAILEARADNRRFSEVYCDWRCDCGRALNVNFHRRNHGSCVMCWREFRMLEKTRRAIGQATKVCRELMRTAKEVERQAA